ncbi:MAG: energy transducer TonB [Bacteroidetes bacterium]|nr:energy transducer TonB [Bacteroidota bacterium]
MHSQNSIEKINALQPDTILSYTRDSIRENQFYLESPFAKASLEKDKTLDKISTSVIYKIELIYTTYRESATFNQDSLNKKRLENLQKIYPQFFDDDMIEWGKIALTGASNKREGKQLFHGFIFTYRLPPATVKIEDEIKKISDLIKNPSTLDSLRKLKRPKRLIMRQMRYDEITPPIYRDGCEALKSFVKKNAKYPAKGIKQNNTGAVYVTFSINQNGNLIAPKIISGIDESCNAAAIALCNQMPLWGPGLRNRKPAIIRDTLIFYFILPDKRIEVECTLERKSYREYKNTGRNIEMIPDSISDDVSMSLQDLETDSAVTKILLRQKFENAIYVCDVTGSMSPYTSQTLGYLQNQMKGKVRIAATFFNDGDDKADNDKLMGETGGVYHVATDNFDTLLQVAFNTMRKGSGGDTPENNIEACLKALQYAPWAKSIVMIADNYATPRDIELLEKLKIPVHVILCGAYKHANKYYIGLARNTKGSVHTMTEDLSGLHKLQDRDTFRFMNKTYRLSRGEIISIN